MIESVQAVEWIRATLKADGVLLGLVGDRVYSDLAPEGAASPWIIISVMAAPDLNTLCGHRVLATVICQVKAIAAGRGMAGPQAVADRMDHLLTRANGATAEAAVLSCIREQAIHYSESDGGTLYRHLGGQYRLLVQET